jgi:tetratricopeptide (TPR) repeat protein
MLVPTPPNLAPLGRTIMALFESTGDSRGTAGALNAAGWCLIQLGEHRAAIEHCQRAVDLHRQLDHPYGEALDLDSLGLAHSRLGEHAAAIRCYERTIAIYRDADDRSGEARALVGLAGAFTADGRSDLAQGARQSAYEILAEPGHPAADAVLLGKAGTNAV